MIEVTEEEVQRWKERDETPMKWDEYPWDVGEKRLPVVVAYGAGLNSTAMLIGCVYQGQPVDKIIFADTGGERPTTYAYVEKMSSWLEERGYPEVEVVRYKNGDGEVVSLEERCLEQDMLPSLAYGFQRKACSQKFKVTPQRKHVRSWEPAQRTWDQDERLIKLIGYDVGETHRYSEAYDDNGKYIFEYPLVDWRWDRDDCERVIVHAGLCVPPKSSCFFCPSMRPEEIEQLKERWPELYERAIELEKNGQKTLQEDSSIEGLGGNWSWQEYMEASEEQLDFKPKSRIQECSCYDGQRSRDETLNEYKSESISMEEKDLPFAIEKASDLDQEREAQRSGGEGEEEVDVTVEEVQATLPGLDPEDEG
jgi:3'-phosphoadenosine 5'-phosphosulfate sulfotransferase (PAPS reductase)/FAD synthetase